MSRAGNESLRDKTYEQIKEAIITDKLRPGAPLSEYWLAKTLGVSRTPVREALGKLESEGFIASIPGRGAVVSGVTAEWVIEIFEYREAIEGLACRAAASRINENTRSALVRNFLGDTCPADLPLLNEIGAALHGAVRDFCGNSMLQNSLDTIRGHVTRLRVLAADIPGRVSQSFTEHQAIAHALTKGDEEEAERAMRRHIVSTKQSFLQLLLGGRLGRLSERNAERVSHHKSAAINVWP